jgi:hypothetical protein
MKTRKLHSTSIYAINEGIFAVVFIFNRAISTTILLYNSMLAEIGLHMKVCMTTVYALGLFWIFVVLSMIAKKFKSKKVDAPTAAFINCISWLRKRSYLLVIVISCWTLFLTLGTRMLNWPHYLLEWRGFVII